MKKVVQVFTVSLSIIFIDGLSEQLSKAGYELHVISSDGAQGRLGVENGEFTFWPIEMSRGISPLSNFISFIKVRRTLKKIRPDVVHGNTPVGGFISMLAAWSLGIKNRVYTMHGLKYPSEKNGIRKFLIKTMEKLAPYLSSKTYVVSRGLRDFAIKEKIAKQDKLFVLNNGSVKGINVEESSAIVENGRKYYEKKYGFSECKYRIGYFGRINEDKGFFELIEALNLIKNNYRNLEILLCGIEEIKDEHNKVIFSEYITNNNVRYLGFVRNSLEYMICCDCIVLPTHREGFGLVNIEANAVGVPVITTDVMGCKDSIEDNVTGLFFQVGNVDLLSKKIMYMIDNKAIGIEMGKAGIERIKKMFNRKDIWNELIADYNLVTR